MARTTDMFDEASDTIQAISIVDERLVAALGLPPGTATLGLEGPSRCAVQPPFARKKYSFGLSYTLEHPPTVSADVMALVDAALREAGLETIIDADGRSMAGKAKTATGNVTVSTLRPNLRDEVGTTVEILAVSACMRLPRGYDDDIELQDDWEERLGFTGGLFPPT
jgi:hypothetical protein